MTMVQVCYCDFVEISKLVTVLCFLVILVLNSNFFQIFIFYTRTTFQNKTFKHLII